MQANTRSSSTSATLKGLGAIALWSSLALLTTLTRQIPPLGLCAITFAIGTAAGLGWAVLRGTPLPLQSSITAKAWLLGVYGLLAYHACYFFALQQAPALEANLINYLWPMLIVLFSALLPVRLGGKRLGLLTIVGAILGLVSTVLVLSGGLRPTPTFITYDLMEPLVGLGHIAALLAAVIWASYSVATRLVADVPSTAIIGSCALTSLGAGGLHLAFEPAFLAIDLATWGCIVAMGIGPVGLAFTLWDEGMKHGNMRLIGMASYATPLVSTALLSLVGIGEIGLRGWIAALLLVLAAGLVAREQ